MKRPQVNLLIDVASFVAFVLLLSTGLLLRFQLPPGSGGLEGHGSGSGSADRVITLLWGQTRHDWGEIHFWIAVALLVVLTAHLLLHWKWIVCMIGGTHGDASGGRFALGLAAAIALVLLAAAPLVAPTQQATRGELLQNVDQSAVDLQADDELRGSMTLGEVSDWAGISVQQLQERLELPGGASADARVGPLLRRSGKHMSDLRRLLEGATEGNASSDKETRR